MNLPSHWQPDWLWYALRVSPGQELKVQERLREADYFTFCQTRHVPRLRRGDKRKVLDGKALYSGYVFIGQPPGFELPWLKIMDPERFPGVHGVLADQGVPLAIYEPQMIAMISGDKNSRPRAYVNVSGKRKRGKRQNTAEIVSGPYQGRTVRMIEIQDGDPELYELFQVAA